MEEDFEGKESADDCETLEKLRSKKRVCKMQLTKLYSHLSVETDIKRSD